MKRIFILILMGTVILAACSTGRWIKTPVLEEKNLTVILEHRMEKDRIIAQNYHHPYKINPLTLNKLLTDLIYTEESGFWQKQTEKPVFQKNEVDRIVPALASALADATPNQRICFTSLNRSKRFLGLFKNKQKTEGVIFIDPANRFNIAFASINVKIDIENNTTELPNRPMRVDPLKLKSSDTVLLPVPSYATCHTDKNGIQRPMWIVIDLDKLQETIKAEPQPANQKPKQKPEATSSLKTTTDSEKLLVRPAANQPGQITDKTTDIPQQERIKNKLSYLKELFESGLINKQEYEAEKKKILDTFK